MVERCDVAIAGAGIVGAACARACAAAGLRVIVADPGPIGGGATAAGMGHIVVMDDSPAQLALTRYSRELWMAARETLPADVDYLSCGTLWIAADEEEMAEVHRKHALYSGAGIRSEVLDAHSLAQAEPHLRGGLAGALLVPDDAVVYPPSAALCFLRGLDVRRVRAVRLSGDGMELADGTFISAGITVNATGTWAPELAPELAVRPRKGHLAITDRYPGFVSHALVELGYLKSAHASAADSVAFNAQPRRTGQVLLGSSRQFAARSAEVEPAMLARMLRRALEYLPEVGELTVIRAWTGFRAATADHLPLIGPTPADPRLLLATGHEGLGITTSLATAQLVCDRILGRASAIAPEPYLPGRSPAGAAHV